MGIFNEKRFLFHSLSLSPPPSPSLSLHFLGGNLRLESHQHANHMKSRCKVEHIVWIFKFNYAIFGFESGFLDNTRIESNIHVPSRTYLIYLCESRVRILIRHWGSSLKFRIFLSQWRNPSPEELDNIAASLCNV